MNDTRLVFLGLILFLSATFPVSAHSADVGRPAPAWMSDLTVVQMLDSPNDYRWMGTWDPVYDYDWHRHYGVVYVRDCDRCAVRDCNRCAVRDCNRCAVRDCDRCATCAANYDSCDRCAARYWDRSAARDCDLCAARDHGRCDRCVVRDLDRYPYASDYRCDLFGCGWVR
jgi:hypothetical protein